MKHAELPYKVGCNGGITGPSVSPLVYLDEKEGCEHTYVSAKYTTALDYESNQAVAVCFGLQQKENAEYIVHACNLYPELIEALEDVLHDPCFNANCDEELWNRISELLKRAKP